MKTKNTITKKMNKRGPEDGYKPEFCDMLVKKMSKGHSFTTFSRDIGIGRTALYSYLEKYPEFKESKEIGEAASQEFLEKEILKKVQGKGKGCTSSLIFMLKTRHHKTFGEKQQIEQTLTVNSLADFVNENM